MVGWLVTCACHHCHVEVSVRTSWLFASNTSVPRSRESVHYFFTIEKRPVSSSPRYVAVATYLGLLATKPQPTKDQVHIQGQNNSFRSNILGFAGEKIENVAKLKQKKAKNALESMRHASLWSYHDPIMQSAQIPSSTQSWISCRCAATQIFDPSVNQSQ